MTVLGGVLALALLGGGAWMVLGKEKPVVEQEVRLAEHILLPSAATLRAAEIAPLGAGSDQALVAILEFDGGNADWIASLEDRRGEFFVPKLAQETLGMAEPKTVTNPKDVSKYIQQIWSYAFMFEAKPGIWVLVAETT